jgi:capsular polysaccharide biosynthesis protein
MELNEAFRRIVLGHLRLLVPFILLPALGTAWLAMSARTEYSASARIQASTATIGSDTEADSLLNRVRGVATSAAIVQNALNTAQVADRSASNIASEVTVSRLGSSPLFDIIVTDPNAAVAQHVSDALATGVLDFLTVDGSRQAQGLVNQLTSQQAQLVSQRKALLAQQAITPDPQARATVSAQLSTLDQQLSDLGSTLRQLQVTMATGSSASLVSPASVAKAIHSNVSTKVVLAVLSGLLAGLLVAAVLEVARPRVSNAVTYAREIGVPVLGRIDSVTSDHVVGAGDVHVTHRASPETVLSLRHAAYRSQAHTVVLVGEPDTTRAAELAATLAAQLTTTIEVKSTSNGRADNARSAVAVSGGTARATKTATRGRPRSVDTRTGVGQEPLRVVLLSDLAERAPSSDAAILVVVADRAPYRQFRGIQDLSAATGWPIIGALREPTRRRGWAL